MPGLVFLNKGTCNCARDRGCCTSDAVPGHRQRQRDPSGEHQGWSGALSPSPAQKVQLAHSGKRRIILDSGYHQSIVNE